MNSPSAQTSTCLSSDFSMLGSPSSLQPPACHHHLPLEIGPFFPACSTRLHPAPSPSPSLGERHRSLSGNAEPRLRRGTSPSPGPPLFTRSAPTADSGPVARREHTAAARSHWPVRVGDVSRKTSVVFWGIAGLGYHATVLQICRWPISGGKGESVVLGNQNVCTTMTKSTDFQGKERGSRVSFRKQTRTNSRQMSAFIWRRRSHQSRNSTMQNYGND